MRRQPAGARKSARKNNVRYLTKDCGPHNVTMLILHEGIIETGTKTTLILSTLAVLGVVSTVSIAQNFVTYSSAYGNANATIPTVEPVDGSIGASDWGYQSGPRQHRARTGR
jgi:urease alpha subunit